MNDIPSHILDRLLILSPEQERADAQRAINALYPAEHARASGIELRQRFNVPRTVVAYWRNIASSGADVSPAIAAWLEEIGVTG